MRWLFLIILCLNLVYVGWRMSVSNKDPYAEIAPLSNVNPIKLLAERKADSQSLAEKEEAVEVGSRQETASTEPDEYLDEDTAVKTQPVKVSSDKSEVEKVKAETAKTSLSDENVEINTKEESSQVDKPRVIMKSPVELHHCYTVGPFRNLESLRGLTRELKEYVVKADFRGKEQADHAIYWVYVQPEKSRDKAVVLGKKLKSRGIKDYYVIRDGAKNNGLSLGHFRNKQSAYGLAKKVRKLGFKVEVEPVYKTYTVYWLDFEMDAEADVPQAVFDRHMKSNKKDRINRLERNCAKP